FSLIVKWKKNKIRQSAPLCERNLQGQFKGSPGAGLVGLHRGNLLWSLAGPEEVSQPLSWATCSAPRTSWGQTPSPEFPLVAVPALEKAPALDAILTAFVLAGDTLGPVSRSWHAGFLLQTPAGASLSRAWGHRWTPHLYVGAALQSGARVSSVRQLRAATVTYYALD
uniref:Uncharacterized protein n=1 Tax=Nothoprocta perdicaria TaxID=30464 RepID=A0A8C7EBK4_NOTPE